jgi:hypothetical protein
MQLLMSVSSGGTRSRAARRLRGSGMSAIFGTHVTQYTRSASFRRNHNPPQRSQYFSSNCSNVFSNFSIMSSPGEQNKKSPAPVSRSQGSFLLRRPVRII